MIHEYWTTLRGSRIQPSRTEFNPGAVPDALGDTFILTIDRDNHFPYRIAGSRICTLFGHDMQGLSFLAPFDSEARTTLAGIIHSVQQSRRVTELKLLASNRHGEKAEFGLVFLPLSSSSKDEGRMLGAMAPSRQSGWIGTERVTHMAIAKAEELPTAVKPTASGTSFRDMKLSLRLIQGGMAEH